MSESRARARRLGWAIAMVVGTLVLTVAVVVIVWRTRPSPPSGPRARFELYEVADEIKALEHARLPTNAVLAWDYLPTEDVQYVVAPVEPNEGETAALQRLRQWAKGVKLPANVFIAFEAIPFVDPQGPSATSRCRTYVLRGPPIVTETDVASARAIRTDEGHAVRFKRAGAERLGDATTHLLRRRVAIVVDGMVVVAPVIMTPITGGSADIAIDGSHPEHEAQALAARLAPR